MKTEVLQFLRNLPKSNNEKFNKAFEFLRKAKGTNFNQMRVYNMYGASVNNINNIIYDLKKHYSITDAEVLSKKPLPKVSINNVVLQSVSNIDLATDNKKSEINLAETSNAVVGNNETDKKTDLHKEFPFLSTKECPAEMHIVTGLLVASWKRYNALHAELQKATTEESELSEEELAQLTSNTNAEFELNGKLYRELEHYRDNQTVLGEIDELKEYRIKQEIATMSISELVKEQKNAASYLTKQKKELEAEDLSDERKALIESRIAERELRLSYVNTKLNIS
ncbi:MAG: hypothetical protein Q4G18_03345 [Myroides sp.]|nr:hypothetical protein [Myroides sp.]